MGQVVAGGAEASPNGLGNLSPHISTARSTSSMGVWNLGRRGSRFGMEGSPAMACNGVGSSEILGDPGGHAPFSLGSMVVIFT